MGGSGICRAAVDSGVQLRTGESHLQVWLRRFIPHVRESDAQRGAARTLPEIKMCVNSSVSITGLSGAPSYAVKPSAAGVSVSHDR